MLNKELISGTISPLLKTDTAMQALSLMEEFKVTHLPVLSSLDYANSELLGVISEDDILNLIDPEVEIGEIINVLKSYFVVENQHVYVAMFIMGRRNLSILPVIDSKNKYVGVISSANIINYLSRFSAMSQAGGVIVLEMPQFDYSLAQISQIVESNDAKILSAYVFSNSSTKLLELTLKLNTINVDNIIHAFQRYDYNIKYTLSDQSDIVSKVEDNYNSLMKYLDI